MQQGRAPLVILSTAALLAFVTLSFLVPRGGTFSYAALWVAAACATAATAAYAYARAQAPAHEPRYEPLRPGITWQVVYRAQDPVPQEMFDHEEPLIALVGDGHLPHPEFVARLAPYFNDPSVAFVQAAMRYDGEGRTASAYRALAALSDECERARDNLGAATLKGSGALICREALMAAYRPGDTFEILGARMQALGYAGRFEPEALMLSWAPSWNEYRDSLASRTLGAWRTAVWALIMRGMPLHTRAQYAAAAAAATAGWAAAAALLLSALGILFFGAGPVIVSSPSALPGAVLLAVCTLATLYGFYKAAGMVPLRAAGLATAGAGAAAAEYAYRAATSERAKRLWAQVGAAARAIVPKGGSAGTAPAGTPARL
jgi:hypothetical protein